MGVASVTAHAAARVRACLVRCRLAHAVESTTLHGHASLTCVSMTRIAHAREYGGRDVAATRRTDTRMTCLTFRMPNG